MSRAALELPVGSIQVSARLRPVDQAAVDMLAVSIEEHELSQPITVRPIGSEEGEAAYELVVGAHRLAAFRKLGLASIPAQVRILTDADARLVEVDENLIRRELTPLERAESIAARFEAWRSRFPERVVASRGVAKPKRGRPGNSANLTEFLNGAPVSMGFTVETAAATGLSESVVKRAAAVFRGLSPALRAKIAASWIARNDSTLRQLAALGDLAEQAAVVDILMAGKTKNVSDARAIAAGATPHKPGLADVPINAVRKAWKAATPSQRAAILHFLAGQPLPKGWEVRPPRTEGQQP